MKRIIALMLVLILILSGCAYAPRSEHIEISGSGAAEGKTCDESFKKIQTELALKLFKSAAEDSDCFNTLVSPVSIELALAMTANGALGDTKTEMESVLGLDVDTLNKYLYSYVGTLTEGDELEVANSIWIRDKDDRLTVNSDFLQKTADYYGASIFKSPFNDSTVKEINMWVENNTDGMINKIIESIDYDVVMYLINATVFDSMWETVYDKNDIYDGTFTSIHGEDEAVKMMHSKESKYLDDGKATGFIKNYKDGRYSFAALLPNEGISIADYIAALDANTLKKTLDNAKTANVNVTMPKFKYEYEFKMNEALKTLGMPTAFSQTLADFSGLCSSELGNIFISDVLHKTYISVDELGTKAGAVTKVEMKNEYAPINELEVNLNRPFVYMILDNSTNTPVFMGTLVDTDGKIPNTSIRQNFIYTCGNTMTTVYHDGKEYTFMGSDSVKLSNILANLTYDEDMCKCFPDYRAVIEGFDGEFGIQINSDGTGYARYGQHQATFTDEQYETVKDILLRLGNNK